MTSLKTRYDWRSHGDSNPGIHRERVLTGFFHRFEFVDESLEAPEMPILFCCFSFSKVFSSFTNFRVLRPLKDISKNHSLACPGTTDEPVVFNYLSRRHGAERFSACGRQLYHGVWGPHREGPLLDRDSGLTHRHEIPAGTIPALHAVTYRQEQIQTLRGNEGRNMARLNIEERFWKDIMILIAKVGDADKAIGNVIRFWNLAQDLYKHDRVMTEEEFKESGFLEAIIPTFAIRTARGVEAVGASKHFGWLKKRVDAGTKGGKVSGKTRRVKSKQNEANTSKSKQPEPSPSPSFSPSYSHSLSYSKKDYSVGEASQGESSANSQIQTFIGVYVKAHQRKLKARPDLNDKKLLGEIKTFLKRYPDFNRACDLIQVYFQMEDEWFQKKQWDFSTFTSNLQKVAAALDTGAMYKPKDAADEWLEKQTTGKEVAL